MQMLKIQMLINVLLMFFEGGGLQLNLFLLSVSEQRAIRRQKAEGQNDGVREGPECIYE